MGINTNLNTAPYHDDYDETKQYVRVLFKPARAVQARELTQLQTILQNQIERFGNNVYQNGTIIEGVNPTVDKQVSFVKINDQSGISDLTIYASTDDITYVLEGQTSGLRAKVLAGANGFQTDAPDLKTFFLNYLKSNTPDENTGVEFKQFVGGELLKLIQVTNSTGIESDITTVTVALSTSTDGTVNNVGNSLAVSVTDGIIYQNGHFNYVEPQLLIASKYTPNPDNISIGFNIEETIVDSSLDVSLLDNAQGFNNQNAPGADRLKLQPKLAVYNTTTRPAEFFSLLRIERGETVFVRGDTQFNSIKQELAKRTFDEAGNYVVDGFDVTTEKDETDGKFYAVIGPGKAYAFGYEVSTVGRQRLEITPSTVTNSKANQSTGADYGAWLTIDVSAGTPILENFNFTSRYNLYATDYNPSADGNTDGTDDNAIGTCSIRSIDPVGGNKVRIYVYAIDKVTASRFNTIGFIGSTEASSKTPVIATSDISNITSANTSAVIFKTGRSAMKSVSDLAFTQKEITTYSQEGGFDTTSDQTIEINEVTTGNVTKTPVINTTLPGGGVFAVTTTNEYVEATNATLLTGTNNIEATFPTGKNLRNVYYDARVVGTVHDTLEDESVWVSTTFNKIDNYGSLGLPNCVKLNKVEYDDGGTWVDITHKFTLVKNAQDGYYGVSYLEMKQGKSMEADVTAIRVNMIALRRTVNGGYLTPNSYAGVTDAAELVKAHPGRDGDAYNLLNCYDFRPYADVTTQYFTAASNAAPVTNQTLQFDPNRAPVSIVNRTTITASQEYYLARFDKLAIDKSQSFVLIEGQPADTPGKVSTNTVFGIADIFVPGKDISKQETNAIMVSKNTTRNYTMRDIERLEKKVNNTVEILALSMLEQDTKDRFIPDANGNNRFKNGILVDQFKDHAVADLGDSDFRSSIHKGRRILAPALEQIPVDLKIDTTSNVTTFDDVTTISSSERETLLFQENATTFRNLASNFYKYNGDMQLAPQFDGQYDVNYAPAVSVEIDLTTGFNDLLDELQHFAPIQQDTYMGTQVTGQTMEQVSKKGWNQTTNYQDSYLRESIVVDSYNESIDLGTYMTDMSLKPYMSSKAIKVYCAGLRPNTQHYFYFDGKPVNNHTSPGGVYESDIVSGDNGRSIKASDVYRAGAKGTAVKTDEFGKLFAVFDLPERAFFVGDADLIISDSDQFESIESAGTSLGRATYHAYTFAIEKQSIGLDIRQPEIELESEIFLVDREITQYLHFDPLAQTFLVDPAQAEGSAYMFTDKLDVWFRRKSPADRKNGITVQIREVQNGYPTAKLLPFGSKHIEWDLINVSNDATTATTIEFDNPIKLEVGKEYAIVLIPDATDPDYFIYTAKVGESLITDDSIRVATDWGMGMLFTSTNNRAWKSYQNEDIKFHIYKKVFSKNVATIDLVPNDMEFFTLSNTVGNFIGDEIAYVQAGQPGAGVQFNADILANRKLTVTGLNADQTATFQSFITAGSMLILTQATRTHVSVVGSISTAGSGTSAVHTVTLQDAPPVEFTVGSCTVTQGIGGKVALFDLTEGAKLAIKESTSTAATQYLTGGQHIITGAQSGATARIQTIYNSPISYVQPMVMEQNTLRTRTSLELFKHTSQHDESLGTANSGQQIAFGQSTYLTNEQRFIPSKQNIINDGNTNTVDRLRFRVTLDNNDFRLVSPTVDNALALAQTYNYTLSNVGENTSQYVSKPVVLQPEHPAEGLRVILAAFRPEGSVIDVQARFLLPSDPDTYTDYVSLTNESPNMYSSSADVNDFREFEYSFDEAAFISNTTATVTDFDAFQIKIVLKHESAGTGTNVFPHVYDYRAIALT